MNCKNCCWEFKNTCSCVHSCYCGEDVSTSRNCKDFKEKPAGLTSITTEKDKWFYDEVQ